MKRIIALLICAALCFGLVPTVLAEASPIMYAAVTATQEDYSDAQVVTGIDNWEEAKCTPNCKFIVIYSTGTGDNIPTLNENIQLNYDDPALILSNVEVFCNTMSYMKLYLLGEASLNIGNFITYTGTSDTGNALDPLPGDLNTLNIKETFLV